MRIPLSALFAMLALNGCASAPEHVAAPTVTPSSQRSEMPTAPWSIIFADGSGNSFHFLQPSAEATAEFEYTPNTPEVSSSGIYSGGMAAAGELTAEQVRDIWAGVDALMADKGAHVEMRMMGTGSLIILRGGVRHQFIVRRGPALDGFAALVVPLLD